MCNWMLCHNHSTWALSLCEGSNLCCNNFLMSALIRALTSLGHLFAILQMLYLFSTVKTCTGICYWGFVSFLGVFDCNDIHLYCIFHPGDIQIKMYVTSPPTQKWSRASDEYSTHTSSKSFKRSFNPMLCIENLSKRSRAVEIEC